jgi:AcrR family transcriptional regulator
MRDDALAKALDDPRGTAARILDAAEEVFAEQGYAAASTREMARRARVPFGAVHYHWGSKAQLWEGVFKRLGDRTRDTLVRNAGGGTTDGEIMDGLVDAFMDLLVAHPNTMRLAYRMALEPRARHLATVRDMMKESAEFGLGLLRERLPGAKIDGPAAVLVISNAFVGALADRDGQEMLLGGDVGSSPRARERLRAELRRVARLVFQVPA